MHHKLATLNEPAAKLKLAHHCLGESKVQHLLRMYGSDFIPELEPADSTIDATLNRIATGMTGFSRTQVAMGIRIGGLGPRTLQDIRTPAELAARLTARPNNRINLSGAHQSRPRMRRPTIQSLGHQTQTPPHRF